MSFLWPGYLWLLLAAPLLVLLYLWLLKRPARLAVRYSSIATARAAASGRNWRRHLPPALLLLACVLLLMAAARPLATVSLPWARSTILLPMDVSLSMRVTDVQPSRMEAAKQAARDFLRDLPRDIEVGLVTFAGSTQVAQAPTRERAPLLAAIDGVQMQRGTAVGNAIVTALAELFPDHGLDVGEMTFGSSSRRQARSLDDRAKPPPRQVAPVAPGSYNAAAIILLSDGRRTTGVDTLQAAKLAADRGVRIHVVGRGTPDGAVGMGEWAIYMQLDEPTLREVARITAGEYHHAGTAEQLGKVYQHLGSRLQVSTRETEVTALLALAAALLMLAAATLSVLWFRKVG